MLREYELTVIANTQLSEENSAKLFKKYENIFLADGGEVVVRNDWGKRKMAYPINKHFRGHYVFYDFTGKPENIAEAERLMRIDENVLRYMVIRLGENIDVDQRKADIAKAEAIAAAPETVGTKLNER